MLKRLFDFSLAVFGLFLFSPLWFIFALAIWLQDRGPIYYTQDRVGRNSRIFKGFKFRSMIPDAEKGLGPIQAKDDDPRVTRVGRLLRKTAMDELPQLLNIAKGDMSFVGPRALRPMEPESAGSSEVKSIFDVVGFKERSTVRPGLTGVAQVFASRHLPREEKFKYDLWYINNQNIWLDMMLIFKSIAISLTRSWDTEGQNTGFFIPLIFIGLIILHPVGGSAFAQEYNVVRGAIDVHSRISDGLYSQDKIAGLAKEKGIKVLIFSESALRKWEYGIWLLRNVIKKTYQENSILRMGINQYLDKFRLLEKKFPDLVIIPGMEVSPYFYWQGSPLSKRCSLIDYYKQFLIIGINEGYRDVPIVGNRGFSFISMNSLLGLWPILIIIFGICGLKKRIMGISFIVIGLLLLSNNLPFSASRFNVYQGYKGVKPYQDLIDYVNRKGGLIFWAHPQALSRKSYFGIESETRPHLEDLFLTHDYAGIGVVFENNKCDMADPGGTWDKLLLEYIEGKRKRPIWIIGNVHYTGESAGIDFEETVFFLNKPKAEDVLAALRQGMMYVRFNFRGEPAVLNEFSVKNNGPGRVQIIIKGSQVLTEEPLKIELVRNGKIFRHFEESSNNWAITAEDNLSTKEPNVYYRLKINSPSTIILSNPVFTEVKK